MKGLGCTDAPLIILHHLLKSLDAWMEFNIVQLDFSAAVDRWSYCSVLFKFKSIGVGGSVLSICTEFLSDRRQRVVVDGAASEWIPTISGVPGGVYWVLFCLSYIPTKCLSWLRTDYLPMQMTPQYWQLFASQQTDLQLQTPLTEAWLEFRSGEITGA